MKNRKNSQQRLLMGLIRQHRIDAGVRQMDIANCLGVNQSRISKWEIGERRIDLFELLEVCKILDVPPEKIIKEFQNKLEEENDETKS